MAIVPRASRAATTPTNPLLLDIANNVLIVNNSAAPAHLPRPNPGRWEHQRAPLSRSFLTRAAAAALFLTLVLLPTPCRAGSGGGEDNGELTTPMPRHHHGEQLGVAVPVVPDVEIFKPSGKVGKSFHSLILQSHHIQLCSMTNLTPGSVSPTQRVHQQPHR
jgi:hypothetical protein